MKVSQILFRNSNNFDLIRTLLACLVILGHAPALNGVNSKWIDPITFFFSFTYSGAFAVKLFFFISGLLVTNSILNKNNPFYFVISRFFRLMPALFFVLLITVFVVGPIVSEVSIYEYFKNFHVLKYIVRNLFFSTDYNIPNVFIHNFYKNTVNGSLWTLRYEIACYLAVLVFSFLLFVKNRVYINILILAVVIDSLLPSRFIFCQLENSPDVYLLPASFAFGAFFAINADKIELKLKFLAIAILILFWFRHSNLEHIIFIFVSSIAVLYLSSNLHIIKIRLKYDISYGIYLWGFLIQQTIYHFYGHLNIYFHIFLALTLSILLAFITNVIIERPFISLGNEIYQIYNRKIQLALSKNRWMK